MQLIQPVISKPRQMLVQVPITGHGGNRADGKADVGSPELAYDGNPATRARFDSASWQTHWYSWDEVLIARIRIRSTTSEGARPAFTIGGLTVTPTSNDDMIEIDRTASRVDIYDDSGGRTFLYEITPYTLR